MSAGTILRPAAEGLVYLTTTQVHSFWFPYLLAPTLHAARISIAFQANARRSSAMLSWGTYILGYLIMCWGGSLLSHFLLGLPPPMLYSFHPYINYLTVHLVLTGFFTLFPSLLHPRTIDTILFPLDALLRTNAVTSTLALISAHADHINPLYTSSPLTHLILGAIASAGGGLSAATLSTWTNDWTFGTPPVLRRGAGLWGTLDVWGGALVAFIYSFTTAHLAFASITLASLPPPLSLLIKSLNLQSLVPKYVDSIPPLSPIGARALAGTVLTVLFGIRVLKVHWLTPPPALPKGPTKSAKAASKKNKAQ